SALAANPPATPPREGGGWVLVILLAVLALVFVVLILMVGTWLLLRNRSAPPVREAAASTDVSFKCSQCQRALKTKAKAAGKKVKCPHCSTMVVVPDVKTGVKPAVKQKQAR